MSGHETTLTERMQAEKSAEQRDRLRVAVEDIRRGALEDWRTGQIDAETAMEGVRDVVEGLPRYVW